MRTFNRYKVITDYKNSNEKIYYSIKGLMFNIDKFNAKCILTKIDKLVTLDLFLNTRNHFLRLIDKGYRDIKSIDDIIDECLNYLNFNSYGFCYSTYTEEGVYLQDIEPLIREYVLNYFNKVDSYNYKLDL